MVEVLLTAAIPQEEKDDVLNQAVWLNNFDLVALLVENGASIHSVDFEEVCSSGNPVMMRFFLDRGIDAVTNIPLARAPMYGRVLEVGLQ